MIEVTSESTHPIGSSPVDDRITLLCVTHPKADESFFGYLVRLAELNGYDDGSWLLELSGVSTSKYAMISRAAEFLESLGLSSLSQMVAVPVEEIQRLVTRHAQYTYTRRKLLRSLHLPAHALGAHAKICPDCLRVSPHSRVVWDAPFVTGCVEHQRLLIDRCPLCGVGIRRLRAAVAYCHCGMDWRPIERSVPLSETADRMLRAVYAALELYSGIPDHPAVHKNVLYGNDMVLMLDRLTSVASQFRSLSRLPSVENITNSQLHRWLVRAFSVFDGWPHRFRVFLDWKHKRSARLNRLRTKPEIIKKCECIRGGSDSDSIRRAAIITNPFVRRQQSNSVPQTDYLSFEDARKKLNLPEVTMHWHIMSGTLIKEWLRKPSRAIVNQRSLEKLKETLQTGLDRNEMATKLRVSSDEVDDLVHLKCLVPFWINEHEYVFSRHAPTQLLDRLRGAICREYPQATENETDSVRAVLEAFGPRFEHTAVQVKAILQGFIGTWECSSCGGTVPRRHAGNIEVKKDNARLVA